MMLTMVPRLTFLASLPDAALVELGAGDGEGSARGTEAEAEPALALYSSVAEEVDGAASWVVGEIARGTRLDELALVVPDVESYAPLLADRLARLAPLPLEQHARPGIPIDVPEGRRALRSPAGRRLAALLHALERWLDAPAIINAATRLTTRYDARRLGDLTLAMLSGEEGPQRREVEDSADFLG